jgi:hypothetical protein
MDMRTITQGGVTFVLQPNHEVYVNPEGAINIVPNDTLHQHNQRLIAENADLREELAALRSGKPLAEIVGLTPAVQTILDRIGNGELRVMSEATFHEPQNGYCLTCGGEGGQHRRGCTA